jgi:predicted GTPase
VTAGDHDVAAWLRRHHGHRPVLVVAAKCDHYGRPELTAAVHDASALGFGDAVPFSAETRAGSVELYDALRPLVDAAHESEAGTSRMQQEGNDDASGEQALAQAAMRQRKKAAADFGGWRSSSADPGDAPAAGTNNQQPRTEATTAPDAVASPETMPEATLPADAQPSSAHAGTPPAAPAPSRPKPVLGRDEPIKIAIAGLPNVGKSTLLNRILGYERALTGREPGLTRDAVGEAFEWNGAKFEVADTAGWMRHATLARFDESGGRVAGLTVVQVRGVEPTVFAACGAVRRPRTMRCTSRCALSAHVRHPAKAAVPL